MYDKLIDMIYGVPTSIDDRIHRTSGNLSAITYKLGYVFGLIVQFVAGFAIGKAIRLIILAIIAAM